MKISYQLTGADAAFFFFFCPETDITNSLNNLKLKVRNKFGDLQKS